MVIRVGGVMTFAPFLGSASLPVIVKAALTLALSLLLCPIRQVPLLHSSGSEWIVLAGTEVVIGLAMGLAVQFVFDAMVMAGEVLGFQLGFSLANIIDPLSQVDTPVLSIFHQMIALLIFLRLDVHHWILRALSRS